MMFHFGRKQMLTHPESSLQSQGVQTDADILIIHPAVDDPPQLSID
jgi:hypothetical protein